MKKTLEEPKQIKYSIEERSNSTGNILAKRLLKKNSLSKLTPLNTSSSILGSLNTSLIPSISLKKLAKL